MLKQLVDMHKAKQAALQPVEIVPVNRVAEAEKVEGLASLFGDESDEDVFV